MRQLPDQPADRDALHPHADQRHAVAQRVEAVIRVAEGSQDYVGAGDGRHGQARKLGPSKVAPATRLVSLPELMIVLHARLTAKINTSFHLKTYIVCTIMIQTELS